MDVTLGSRASRPAMGVVVNGTSTRSSTAEELPRGSEGDPPGDEGRHARREVARDNTKSANTRSAHHDIARGARGAPIPVARGRRASPGMLQTERCRVPLEPRTPSGCLSERSNLQKIQTAHPYGGENVRQ